MEHERPQIVLELFAGCDRDGGNFQVCLNVLKSGGAQAGSGAFGIGEEPGLGEFTQPAGELLRLRQGSYTPPQARDVGAASALRMQPATGTEYGEEIAEEYVVIENPVE